MFGIDFAHLARMVEVNGTRSHNWPELLNSLRQAFPPASPEVNANLDRLLDAHAVAQQARAWFELDEEVTPTDAQMDATRHAMLARVGMEIVPTRPDTPPTGS